MIIQFLLLMFLSGMALFGFLGAGQDFRRNRAIVRWSLLVSAVIAMPFVQSYVHLFGQPAGNVYVPPVFIALYILFGRFNLPSPRTAFSGTFFTLLFGDLVSATINAFGTPVWWMPFTWIGGANFLDGLFVMPVAAALSAWALASLLSRGCSVSILFGRNQHLRDGSNSDCQ